MSSQPSSSASASASVSTPASTRRANGLGLVRKASATSWASWTSLASWAGSLGALALVSLGSTACQDTAYCFDCDHSAGVAGVAGVAGSAGSSGSSGAAGTSSFGGNAGDFSVGGNGGSPPDAGPDACSANTDTDAQNCGTCGHVCEFFGAFPKCEGGTCKIDHCAAGFIDHNGIADDGCEQICSVTNNGVEICDGIDNDCDGNVDNGFDLKNDAQNCGQCGNVCHLGNATAKCAPVNDIGTCQIDACLDGFSNSDGLDTTGCEYTCPVFPITAELCNALDDDCDGVINNGNPGGGDPCTDHCPGGVCQGECTPGMTVCTGTSPICVPGITPVLEVCNSKDDDCDGVVDNGFDLQTDPLNCGTCGHVCALDNAVASCVAANCVIESCLPGFRSNDSIDTNGCEYTCPVSPPTIEVCDGVDNDCNGTIDDPALIAAQKPPSAGCYPTPGTPCAGADFVCAGALKWRCNYGAGVETDADGKLVIAETQCDGIDGNCNGQVDEAFAGLGTECDNGLLGACRDVGKRVCDPSDESGTKCDLSVLPDPVPSAPDAETCNGVDDDCDGVIDNGIVDDMVSLTNGAATFKIDRYEASRPDATSSDPGLNEARRCVLANKIPWTLASEAEAAAACAVTGGRLCTAAELEFACATASANKYPYGNTYAPNSCDGLDNDSDTSTVVNDDELVPTGSKALCKTASGIYDLSGNAAEWSSTVTGNTGAPLNLSIYMVKGGSYQTPSAGLTCQFTLSRYAKTAILPDIGFRCCSN